MLAGPGLSVAYGQSSLNTEEVRSYARDYGVSMDEATGRMSVLAKGWDLVDAMDRAYGKGHGGVWFDHAQRRFNLALPGDVPDAAARRIAQERGLAGDVAFPRVRWSMGELEDAQDEFRGRADATVPRRRRTSGIRTDRNAVVVLASPSATAQQRAGLDIAAARSGGRVVVERGSQDDFEVEPSPCQQPDCDRPLRGGVEIFPTGRPFICTAGYMARMASGIEYVITAGHCTLGTGTWKATHNSTLEVKTIGEARGTYYGWGRGDMGQIQATGSFWDQGAGNWASFIAQWGWTTTYPIQGRASSFVNQYVCHSGITTGRSCGTVSEIDREWVYSDGTMVYDMTVVSNACEKGGDSGGPWAGHNIAYGVHSGGTHVCGGATALYTDVVDIEREMAVRIETS